MSNSLLTQEHFRNMLEQLSQKPSSQSDLAKALDMSAPYLWSLIRGRQPVSDKVIARLGYEKQYVKVAEPSDPIKAIMIKCDEYDHNHAVDASPTPITDDTELGGVSVVVEHDGSIVVESVAQQ